ncbi:hypothetical protein PMAC_003027 [Pneumocystis sp. 'macacae']|nr:hypothetical protein PMAC_003027 [Pneumocystis sp. 'macacae']
MCYQCQVHLGCSESFYKNSVEQEIKSKKVTKEEKNKMLKLLLKFKYNQKNIENFEFYNNEVSLEKELKQSDLKERMKDVDLESASFEEIWKRLNSNEREEFVHLALTYNKNKRDIEI